MPDRYYYIRSLATILLLNQIIIRLSLAITGRGLLLLLLLLAWRPLLLLHET